MIAAQVGAIAMVAVMVIPVPITPVIPGRRMAARP
jgi:hypothetical protein